LGQNKSHTSFSDNRAALVYPAVVRQVLYRVLVVEDYAELDGPQDDWKCQWLRFACALAGVLPPPERRDDDENAPRPEDVDWIEEAVKRFCDHHKLAERFIRANQPEGDR